LRRRKKVVEPVRTIQADRIQQLREMRNLTTADVAKVLNMPEALYTKLEASRFEMPATLLIELAVFYGVTTDFIVGLSDDLAAAGRYQKDDEVDFYRFMLEVRSDNPDLYQTFCTVIHDASLNPKVDSFSIIAKYFPQYSEELKALEAKG